MDRLLVESVLLRDVLAKQQIMRSVRLNTGGGITVAMMDVQTKTCSHAGCTNIVQKGGVCIKHGLSRRDMRRKLALTEVAQTGEYWEEFA